MTINVNKALSVLRQVSAYLGVIITTTNSIHFPENIRATLLAASSVLLTVEHLNFKTAAAAVSSTNSTSGPVA